MDYEFAVSCIFSRFAFDVISLLTEQLFWFVRHCAKVGHWEVRTKSWTKNN